MMAATISSTYYANDSRHTRYDMRQEDVSRFPITRDVVRAERMS